MKLYNTLTRTVEDFQPRQDKIVTVYSCGPTVYDHIHIGNLSAFIAADMLRRTLQASGFDVRHIMNFTDVDDKTIRRSREEYPDMAAEEALAKLTRQYEAVFMDDMAAIGNDTAALIFIRATEAIPAMQELIRQLYAKGFAYLADDGVYFSIDKYRASGKTYGQLVELTTANTSEARINNDEYDKASAHDFALWKLQKAGEPAWEFDLDGHRLLGRPGWHIECSAMSGQALGQPFDIHTGGVDLIFPHHENEIAQSTAGRDDATYARYFVHNEHLLVDGKKMSKSLQNFYTLRDIQEHGFEPLAFRLMMLQAHYRSQTNFTWENLQAAQNRLKNYRAMADQRWQPRKNGTVTGEAFEAAQTAILAALQHDLNTAEALSALSALETAIDTGGITLASQAAFNDFLVWLDHVLGLRLAESQDISMEERQLLDKRQTAREAKDWAQADTLRDQLADIHLGVRDTPYGQVWYRL
jgi:cysteinyl-tRNA synthetase